MVQSAKEHEAEDKVKREKIDTRNQADATVFQVEKQLKEFGDKFSADSKAKVEAGVERVKEALKSDNHEEIKASMEALNSLMQQASSEMYQNASQQQQAQPGPDPSQAAPGADTEATDAEFEEVK